MMVVTFDRNCKFWFSLVQNFFLDFNQKSAMVQSGSVLLRPDARRSKPHSTKTMCFGSVWFSTFETRRKMVPVIFDGNEVFRLFGPVLRGIHPIFAASLGVIYIRETACILCRDASYTFGLSSVFVFGFRLVVLPLRFLLFLPLAASLLPLLSFLLLPVILNTCW